MTVPGGAGNRSFLVPIVALGSTLVGLVVAIGVVVVLRAGVDGGDGGRREPAGTGAASPTAEGTSARADARSCLVGRWRVTSHTEQVDVPGIGELSFTGAGSELSLGADGTGIVDYGTGTTYRSGYAGRDVVLELRGTVTYRYQVAGDRVELADVRSEAEVRLRVGDDAAGPWRHFTASSEPFDYTCTGTGLTHRTLVYTTSYLRSG
ncbi:hypothetical protein ACN28C_05645 [Plantactinospora sp. WMMC1484]|uniref:hypothetical protein n=1 Tax=Plantactinospora sp. WMMC1484 TaxID=3404122 RepID=UPI003BF45EB7